MDGAEVPTFMVSPSFVGVSLPAGPHAVSAEYRGAPYRTALLVVGLLVLASVLVSGRQIERFDARLAGQKPARG